jgi:hypothetical protein
VVVVKGGGGENAYNEGLWLLRCGGHHRHTTKKQRTNPTYRPQAYCFHAQNRRPRLTHHARADGTPAVLPHARWAYLPEHCPKPPNPLSPFQPEELRRLRLPCRCGISRLLEGLFGPTGFSDGSDSDREHKHPALGTDSHQPSTDEPGATGVMCVNFSSQQLPPKQPHKPHQNIKLNNITNHKSQVAKKKKKKKEKKKKKTPRKEEIKPPQQQQREE